MPSKKSKANLPLVMAGGNTVDIFRSKRIANIFFFFVSAAKASLLPFLTIYFRLLGLSPIQTGIVMGTQAMVTTVFVPFWLKISYLCNKKKFLMLCSIFILIVSHLSLTAVPPRDRDSLLMWCPPSDFNATYMEHSSISPHHNNSNMNGTNDDMTLGTLPPTNGTMALNETSTETTIIVATVQPPTTASAITLTNNPTLAPTNATSFHHSANIQPAPTTATAAIAPTTAPSTIKRRKRQHSRSKRSQSCCRLSLSCCESAPDVSTHSLSLRSLGEQLSQFQSHVYSISNRTFVLVLLIVIIGEMFSCAAEKFADDAWFTLLDSVDDVEKYGSHKYWSAIAYIFYAVVVALVVDTQECFLSIRIHHFMIHFYVFAALMVVAFFTGFFYPFYPRDKPSRHHVNRSKLKILCSDLRSFFFVFTIILMGCANACITVFLFWLVQDVGGTETQMGVVVMIRSIAELFMLVFAKYIIRRLGIPFCTVFGILAMVARLLYFSFLWSPWAVVCIEILYGLSNTLLWQAVCMHPDFSLNIITRRVTQNVFYVLYYGLGCSIGCILAGYGYEYESLPLVYQCAAAVVGVWALLFAIAQRCLPKPPQVKYARLLADEDEESESDEDDWLEMALKNH